MITNKINDIVDRAYIDGFYLTKFLDAQEQIEINAVKKKGLKVFLDGGYADAERKRAFITVDKNPIFDITVLSSKIDNRFSKVSHRNVLGTIMSLGIQRNTFGDIIVTDEFIFIISSNEMADFLIKQVTMILHQPISLNVCEFNKIPIKEEKFVNIVVPSMRIDCILSKGMNLSRNEAQNVLNAKRVLVNYVECTKDSYNCKIGDVISIMRFGRIEIMKMIKTTKKNHLLLTIGVKH